MGITRKLTFYYCPNAELKKKKLQNRRGTTQISMLPTNEKSITLEIEWQE